MITEFIITPAPFRIAMQKLLLYSKGPPKSHNLDQGAATIYEPILHTKPEQPYSDTIMQIPKILFAKAKIKPTMKAIFLTIVS